MKPLTFLFTACLCQGAAAQSMFTDEFNGTLLDQRWIRFNPNVDSDTVLTGSELLLVASPANGGSDYFTPTNYNGTRVLQPLCGNWIVEAKLHVSMSSNFQGAGFLLIAGDATDTNEGHRWMERRFSEQCITPATHGFWLVDTLLCDIAAGDTSMLMRLERSGDQITGRVSFNDGIDWESATVTDPQDFRYIGVNSLRYDYDGGTAAYTNAYYDYFRFLDQDTLHIDSQEGSLLNVGDSLHISIDTVANGEYAWYGPTGSWLGDSAAVVIDSLTALDAGWYYVVVSRLDCQFLTDSFLLDVTTAVEEARLPPALITIAPNPAKELITVSWSSGAYGAGELQVLDATGRVTMRKKLSGANSASMNIAEISSGTYFVRLRTTQGEAHGRFIKE